MVGRHRAAARSAGREGPVQAAREAQRDEGRVRRPRHGRGHSQRQPRAHPGAAEGGGGRARRLDHDRCRNAAADAALPLTEGPPPWPVACRTCAFSISAACSPVRGPAQMLADFGADVIKVEHPVHGDDVRRMGVAHKDAQGRDTGETSSYLAMNRGKRSIGIDISKPSGQALVKRLAATSDVLIENFKTGNLATLRPRLRGAADHQSAPGLLLDHRLRAIRALQRASRLRPDLPGHERPHEHHRRAGRSAWRRDPISSATASPTLPPATTRPSRSSPRSTTATGFPARANTSTSRCSTRRCTRFLISP